MEEEESNTDRKLRARGRWDEPRDRERGRWKQQCINKVYYMKQRMITENWWPRRPHQNDYRNPNSQRRRRNPNPRARPKWYTLTHSKWATPTMVSSPSFYSPRREDRYKRGETKCPLSHSRMCTQSTSPLHSTNPNRLQIYKVDVQRCTSHLYSSR